jgi:hypothetical protein
MDESSMDETPQFPWRRRLQWQVEIRKIISALPAQAMRRLIKTTKKPAFRPGERFLQLCCGSTGQGANMALYLLGPRRVKQSFVEVGVLA